jgi:site-specific recombinase XerD
MLNPDVQEYLAYRAVAGWSEATAYGNRCVLRRVVAWLEQRGHRRWATVTAADLDALLLELLDRNLRPTTAVCYANALRGLGRWLTERGRVLRNPAAYLMQIERDEAALPPAPLTEEQVTALFNAVPRRHVIDLRNRLHLEILYSCALRVEESLDLNVGDLDLNARTLFVQDGKFGNQRLLPILTSTLNAAAEYLALRRDLVRGPDKGALFLNYRGQRLGYHHVRGWLKKTSRSLGFHAHPHLMRHSLAVHLLRRGCDIRNIQMHLGHKSLESTKVYLRLVPGHLREDYDRAMPTLMPEEGITYP